MGVQPITVPQSLAYVLNNAGDKSGVDFDYLVKTAMRESSLNPDAKAPSSSAVGLFQFLDTTWLQVMKEEGPRLGYQKYADAITQTSDGDYTIKDKKLRAEVLKLREDPQVAADMAAAFTRSNGAYLQSKFGRMPSAGELYIAHFLGPQGAEKLFNAGLDNPDQVAAKLFPSAAKANPQIFYSGDHPRTIREVYKALVAQHDGIVAAPLPPDPTPAFAAQQIASDPQNKWSTDTVPSRFSKADMSFTSLFATVAPTGVAHPLIPDTAADPLVPDTVSAPLALAAQQNAKPSAQSLAAIDAAITATQPTPTIGSPFDAPDPLTRPLALMATGSPSAPTEVTASPDPLAAADGPVQLLPPDDAQPVDDGMPQARILMTPRPPGSVASAFLTQLFSQREVGTGVRLAHDDQ